MPGPRTRARSSSAGYSTQSQQRCVGERKAVDADLVLAATPIDLRGLLDLDVPVTRVRYELAQVGGRPLGEIVAEALETE